MKLRTLSAAAAALLLCAGLTAQDTRARVQGVVTDSTQAVVAGATVTLRNNNTSVQAQAATTQTGAYLFDFVLPGTYTVLVEMAGFKQFVQQNVLVQARGDVTVNAALEVGTAAESITVEASPVAVQFNTTTMALTLDTKMANSLPIIHRNPFLLVSLNPATVIRSTTEQSPFHHWAASQFDVGGNTNTKNDIILDGAPSMTTQKSSYTPPMDAVQEVNLQQNAVDAEFGHSAGGVLAVQMKSGTNEFHGTGYYLGRNPKLNAMADRLAQRANLTRQNVWGVTLGNPILRNRLFSFFSYEGWRTIEPRTSLFTLPTDLEAAGNFSQSRNTQGNLRTIYDPFTTVTQGNVVTRQPFAGNIIPQSQMDPVSRRVIGELWKPNGPGTGPTGVNNFISAYANRFKYYNFSERVDWNISDNLKVFGRYNRFKTFTVLDDFTGSRWQQPDGSARHSRSFSGDLVYTINASTVFNIRGAYNGIVDSFRLESALIQPSDLEAVWGGLAWNSPYMQDLPDLYLPGITVTQGSSTVMGRTGYWFQEPNSHNIESKISKNIGRHYVKVGGEYRRENVLAARYRIPSFAFGPALTANTYLSPNTALSGDGWATFLLGALDGGSNTATIPTQRPSVDYVGFFLHDDFKINQRLTLNLGLRYEYFTPMRDETDRLSRFLDLTNPIPEFQGSNAPVLPAQAVTLRGGAPVAYNGAWIFADSENRGSWNAPRKLFLPRAGIAWRADGNTAIRIGYARYIVPATLTDGLNILGSVPYPGFDAQTNTIGPLQGVPQQRFANPYPAGLVPVVGKGFGRYTGLGGATTWYEQDFKPGVNDRINFSIQRQLPLKILADITYFINIGRDQPYNYDVNQIDPRIGYQVQNAVTTPVPNPFFNRLPADKFPGQLRTQASVPVSQLLRPYPHYQGLTETLRGARDTRYRALQMQFQRPFVNGFNLVIGYNYNTERNQEFYDEQDNFTHTFTYQPATNAKHRLTGAAIYELPFGKGRRFMTSANPVLDGVLGGWALSGLFTYNSGIHLRFGNLIVSGDPKIGNPTRDRMFNTDVFAIQQPFTRRSNPLQYSGVTGMRNLNVDMTLAKEFPIKESVKFELRMEAYNAANRFTGVLPDVNRNSPNFGRIVQQQPGTFGRQFQYTGRFIW